MNPAERLLRKVDGARRRFRPSAFVFGVIKKYGDDNGGVLVTNLAHTPFVTIFPLLLVLVTVLVLVVGVDPGFRQDAVNAVAGQVPLIGNELAGNVHQLQRSSLIGLIVGLVTLLWGTTGLAQAGLFTMEQVWNLPGPARPGFLAPRTPAEISPPAPRTSGAIPAQASQALAGISPPPQRAPMPEEMPGEMPDEMSAAAGTPEKAADD